MGWGGGGMRMGGGGGKYGVGKVVKGGVVTTDKFTYFYLSKLQIPGDNC